MVVEVGYLGNLSRKLSSANISVNQIPGDRVDAIRPAFLDLASPTPQSLYLNSGINGVCP